jgi:hypothetical protein
MHRNKGEARAMRGLARSSHTRENSDLAAVVRVSP